MVLGGLLLAGSGCTPETQPVEAPAGDASAGEAGLPDFGQRDSGRLPPDTGPGPRDGSLERTDGSGRDATPTDAQRPRPDAAEQPDGGDAGDAGDDGTPPNLCLPGACQDDDPCTLDLCQAATGACLFLPAADGLACEDGDPCTEADECQAGVCQSGGPRHCPAGPCERATCTAPAGCGTVGVAGPCDDDDPCTTDDHCAAGACAGTPVSCEAAGPCVTGSCDPLSGDCLELAVPEGTPCDDQDACTGPDRCAGTLCVGAPRPGCDDGNPCTQDTCDRRIGCVFTPQPGQACDDDDACTSGERCTGEGRCAGGAARECEDFDPCTADGCEPRAGCTHAAEADGTPCSQPRCAGAWFFPIRVCQQGRCELRPPDPCDDGNPCTEDACDPAGGCVHPPAPPGPCQDGNPCTTDDSCREGWCVGTNQQSCDDGNPCTRDECDPQRGCITTHVDDTCDADGDPCTLDRCQAGACVFTGTIPCQASDACNRYRCVANGNQPVCVHEYLDAGCDDRDPCTVNDRCLGGDCRGAPRQCPAAGNPCVRSRCDAAQGGCVTDHLDQACDDQNPCTLDDRCQAGECRGTHELGCADDDPCTFDHCIQGQGCVHDWYDCNDRNPCTDDACVPRLGGGLACVSTPNQLPCDDLDLLTGNDICVGGRCVGLISHECLTDDMCLPLDGPDRCGPRHRCIEFQCVLWPAAAVTCLQPAAGTCRQAVCNPASGACEIVPGQEDTPCQAADRCAATARCRNGACVTETVLPCDDGNECTADLCHPTIGCYHPAVDGFCEDGDACTEGEYCADRSCGGGRPRNCDDGNPCTTDACDPDRGCSYTPHTTLCDDGVSCTLATRCQSGRCGGGCPCPVAGPPQPGPRVTTLLPQVAATAEAVWQSFVPTARGALTQLQVQAEAPGGVRVEVWSGAEDAPPRVPDPDRSPLGSTTLASAAPLLAAAEARFDPPIPLTPGEPLWLRLSPLRPPTPLRVSYATADPYPAGRSSLGAAADLLFATTVSPCQPDPGCADDPTALTLPLAACDDGNPCTLDQCEPAAGCRHTPQEGPCDDREPCTAGDACRAGRCEPGPRLHCDDGDPCTTDQCDPTTGTCRTTPTELPCDDGIACTIDERCGAHGCRGCACSPLAAAQIDQEAMGQEATWAASTVWQSFTPAQRGLLVSLRLWIRSPLLAAASPLRLSLHEGEGPTGPPVRAWSSTAPAAAGTDGYVPLECAPPEPLPIVPGRRYTLRLSVPRVEQPWLVGSWAEPDDADRCTRTDTCAAGLCRGQALRCDDGDPCTDDGCNPATGTCQALANEAPCDDGDACTTNEACRAGVCGGCSCTLASTPVFGPDQTVATDRSAQADAWQSFIVNQRGQLVGLDLAVRSPLAGQSAPAELTLYQGTGPVGLLVSRQPIALVSTTDAFQRFELPTPVAVEPQSTWTWRLTTPRVERAHLAYGTENPYVWGRAGEAASRDYAFRVQLRPCRERTGCVYTPGQPTLWRTPCDDEDPCTDDVCQPATGECEHHLAPHPCDDGNACTRNDACTDGGCTGTPLTCDDGVACTTDRCDPATGCQHQPTDAACDDQDACTVDRCEASTGCVHEPRICDPAGACRRTWCDPTQGCLGEPIVCDDQVACTENRCDAARGCLHLPRDGACDDGHPCTRDTCRAEAGCVHEPVAGACDDGDACTVGEACDGGTCGGCRCQMAAAVDEVTDGEQIRSTHAASGDDLWQSFTVRQRGGLTAVELAVQAAAPQGCPATGCPATLELYAGEGLIGLPLMQQTVLVSSAFPGRILQRFALPAPVPVGPGRRYTFRLTVTRPTLLNFSLDPTDPYPGGQSFRAAWGLTEDLVFRIRLRPCTDLLPCTNDPTRPTLIRRECDDGNPCTTSTCDPQLGCRTISQDGGPCDDGNPCTQDDRCGDGGCQPGAPDPCDDGVACTADSCLDGVGCLHAPRPATCDDANPCTEDRCDGQLGCIQVPRAAPCASDDNECTDDRCADGRCQHLPHTRACDDGLACSITEACWQGRCGGCDCTPAITPEVAAAPARRARAEATDRRTAWQTFRSTRRGLLTDLELLGSSPIAEGPGEVQVELREGAGPAGALLATGQVSFLGPAGPDQFVGLPFDPPLPVVAGQTYTWTARVLTPGTPRSWLAFQYFSGAPAGSCSLEELPGNRWNKPEFLFRVQVRPCLEQLPCTDDPAVPTRLLRNCDEGDRCTSNGCAEPGGCWTTPVDCADGDPCTQDACHPQQGCLHAPLRPEPCEDGSACTVGDLQDCLTGECQPGAPLDCDDGQPCTADLCDPARGCVHQLLTGPACDDGDACTVGDHCMAGGCSAGAPRACDDQVACTQDECDPALGCTHRSDPTHCADGDACTQPECDPHAGCRYTLLRCDDQDPCTRDVCEPTQGCLRTPVDCDDGAACTTDQCVAGRGCVHTPADDRCDDGSPCTLDRCQAEAGGCTHTPRPDAVPCDDAQGCTTEERCDPQGACGHGCPCTLRAAVTPGPAQARADLVSRLPLQTRDFWQSFTPLRRGGLTRLELLLDAHHAGQTAWLELRRGEGVAGELLAEQQVTLPATGLRWHVAEFTPPVPLVPGVRQSWRLRTDQDLRAVALSQADAYAQGRLGQPELEARAWYAAALQPYDLAFRSSVRECDEAGWLDCNGDPTVQTLLHDGCPPPSRCGPATCEDDDPCTIDGCDPATGCRFTRDLSSCCAPRSRTGCEEPACMACVCAHLPDCCTVAWSPRCAAQARAAACAGACTCPDAACLTPPAGCRTDAECEDQVACTSDVCELSRACLGGHCGPVGVCVHRPDDARCTAGACQTATCEPATGGCVLQPAREEEPCPAGADGWPGRCAAGTCLARLPDDASGLPCAPPPSGDGGCPPGEGCVGGECQLLCPGPAPAPGLVEVLTAAGCAPAAICPAGLLALGDWCLPEEEVCGDGVCGETESPEGAGQTVACPQDCLPACNGARALCSRTPPEVTFPATRASAASTAYPLYASNPGWATQTRTLTQQLDEGIRFLDLDVSRCFDFLAADASPAGGTTPADAAALLERQWGLSQTDDPPALCLCRTRGTCHRGLLPLGAGLAELGRWLAAHPTEIVLVSLSAADREVAARVHPALLAAGLGPRLYAPPFRGLTGEPFPYSLETMVRAGQQLIVFAEGCLPPDLLAWISCNAAQPAVPAGTSFVASRVAHDLHGGWVVDGQAACLADTTTLSELAQRCQAALGRRIGALAVDFYEQGAGSILAAARANGVEAVASWPDGAGCTGCGAPDQPLCPAGRTCRGGRCLPLASPGTPCSQDAECASGRCDLLCRDCAAAADCPPDQTCRRGNCVARFDVQQSCLADEDCASGQCRQGQCRECTDHAECNGASRCVLGRCEPRLAAGASCTADADCTTGHCLELRCVACLTHADCPATAYCRDHACVPQIATHDWSRPCSEHRQCLSEACVGGYCRECRTHAQCRATEFCDCEQDTCFCRLQLARGQCADDGWCTSGACLAGRCAECRTDQDCPADRWCETDRQCWPVRPAGQPCDRDRQCTGGTCALPPGTPDWWAEAPYCLECLTDDACGDLAYCEWGLCRSLGELGHTCTSDRQCLSGICHDQAQCGDCRVHRDCRADSLCSYGICQPFGEDLLCTTDQDCPPGWHCRGAALSLGFGKLLCLP